MTTEHERALSNAHRVNDILREECTEFELQRVAARLALAERDAEIARLKVPPSTDIAELIARLEQPQEGHHIAQIMEKHWLTTIKPALLAWSQQAPPGYLSGKLNPFPERLPATQATEIAEKLIRAYLLDIGAGMDDFTQHEVEFSEKIAAAIGAAAQAPASSGASALEIAERFRVFFQRPYPTSEEGVNLAVMSLAEAIEAAIAERDTERTERDGICFREGVEFGRAQMGKHGPSALEATRDLFQSLEGWRPTDDWTGVPPRLRLLFDRTLHAIEAAEARGRERL